MKKLLLLLLLVPMVSLGQFEWENGYKSGYKNGYCNDVIGCVSPIPPAKVNMSTGTTFQDGYNQGVIDGNNARQKKENEDKAQFSSYSQPIANTPLPTSTPYKSDTSGSYANPKYVPEVNVGAEVGQAAAKAGAQIGAALAAKMASIKKSETIVPLKVDLNAFKYLVITKSLAGKQAGRAVIKRIKKQLSPLGYNVIDLTGKKKDNLPEELKSNKSLALYSTVLAKDNMSGAQANIKFFDSEDNLVHETSAADITFNRTVKNVISEFISHPYKYNPNAEKYLPVQLSQAEIQYKEQQVESAKDVAMKELKRHKELLDMGLLTQEEFDKKAAELKKVILGN